MKFTDRPKAAKQKNLHFQIFIHAVGASTASRQKCSYVGKPLNTLSRGVAHPFQGGKEAAGES